MGRCALAPRPPQDNGRFATLTGIFSETGVSRGVSGGDPFVTVRKARAEAITRNPGLVSRYPVWIKLDIFVMREIIKSNPRVHRGLPPRLTAPRYAAIMITVEGTQRSRHVAPLSRICTSARRLCRLPCAVRLEATG